jgi:hypothetical protein
MNFRTIVLVITILFLSQKGFSQEEITQEIYTRYYAIGNYKMVDWHQDDFEKQISYDIGYRVSGYGIFVCL